MEALQLIHLLIVGKYQDAPDKLISALRNKSYSIRAATASSVNELAGLLEAGHWNVIVNYQPAFVTHGQIVELLHKYEQEVPLILVTNGEDADQPLTLLEQGIQDVLPFCEPDRVLISVIREATNSLTQKHCRLLEVQLKELEQRYKLVLNSSNNAIAYIQHGLHLYCNQSYADFFSFPDTKTIMATAVLDLIAEKDRAAVKSLLKTNSNEACSTTVEILNFNGNTEHATLSFTPLEEKGERCLQLLVENSSAHISSADSRTRLNNKDLLTRLDKYSHFLKRIEQAINTAVKETRFSSLLIVEINEFVDLSSAIGKANTNAVLRDLASFLGKNIHKPYAAGRLGEHTFGIILYEGNPDEALKVAHAIKNKIGSTISSAMLPSLQLSCSIGMALINGHALDAEDILAKARVNLNLTPVNQSTSYEFRISDSLEHDAQQMINYLNQAIAQQRFKLLFQPIVNIKGDNSLGYEVLCRMLDSDGNDIQPGAFFPLANLNGMGEEIDKLIFTLALQCLKNEQAIHRLTINLTNNSLVSPTFLPWLSELLQQTRTSADLLVVQISEIDIYNSVEHTQAFCQGLKELGLKLTISHFGCALDPFKQLSVLQPEYVKLDESVIRDIIYSTQQKLSVQKLISNIHNMGLKVVVSHVENMDTLSELWQAGTDYVQGFCIQAPSQEMNYEFIVEEEITLTAIQS